MTGLLLWWLLLAGFALWISTRRSAGSPLLLLYFCSLSMIHVPGAVNYLGRSVQLFNERETVAGFQLTLVGLTAMLVVVGVLQVLNLVGTDQVVRQRRLPRETVNRVIVVGVLTYFIFTPLAAMLPSGTAMASTLAGLLPIGFWFWASNAARSDTRWVELARISVFTLLLPVATLLGSGFLGFGISLALSIGVMVLVVWPQRSPLILALPVIAYLGLSMAASYLIQRNDIRAAVWGGEDYATRINASLGVFTEFKFYDLNDNETVWAIESRLNQNALIGVGLQAHENGFSELQYGATVPLWSLIPRALWPDKPLVGGGGQVVSEFTGLTFAGGTSVGAGNPFEFYINFGWPGVIIGFLLLGALLYWHDRHLMAGLLRNDLQAVVRYGLPGLTLMNPGGNLMETLIAYVAAHFVAHGFVTALGSPFIARVLGFNSIVVTTVDRLRGRRLAPQER